MEQPTTPNIIVVEALTDYSPKDATELGQLMPFLSSDLSDSPISEKLLTEIINSPYHEQLVARDENENIVGAATLSITMGVTTPKAAYLNDFVVNPHLRGLGIGSQIWESILDWCKNNNIPRLEFTSNPATKADANKFYLKRGAAIRQTNFFRKDIEL